MRPKLSRAIRYTLSMVKQRDSIADDYLGQSNSTNSIKAPKREKQRVGSGVRSTSLRDFNLSLLLKHVITGNEPLSRARLSQITGLNRSTVTRLVDYLIECGMVTEQELVVNGAGRPAIPLAPAQRTHTAIGIELDRTSINLQAVDLAGLVIAENYIEYSSNDFTKILETTHHIIKTAVEQIQHAQINLVGITLAMPGLIDNEGTSIVDTPSLNWPATNITAQFEDLCQTTHTPITLLNSATAAGIAEQYFRQKDGIVNGDFIYIGGQNGIGAAHMAQGKFPDHPTSWGGELGHTFVSDSGKICTCGRAGCLEAYAGRMAIIELAGLPPNSTDGHLQAALARKDKNAVATLHTTGTLLGRAVSNYVNLVDTTEILVGGYLRALFPYFKHSFIKELNRSCLRERLSPLRVDCSISGSNAPSFGAAWSAIHRYISTPSIWHPIPSELLNFKSAVSSPTIILDDEEDN